MPSSNIDRKGVIKSQGKIPTKDSDEIDEKELIDKEDIIDIFVEQIFSN